MSKQVGLIILDGWGHGRSDESNAIFQARTPFIDSLYSKHSNATLRTDGLNVGLPDKQMGNSEVGHMNIGAGRIVFQDLVKINKSIEDGSFFENKNLKDSFLKAKQNKAKVHFIGLLGNGGVHSNQEHLVALSKMATDTGLQEVYIHGFTDGRDTDPKSGLEFINQLQDSIVDHTSVLASLIGRYYAMDRDNRWERIKKAYDCLVNREGKQFDSFETAMIASYEAGITDEFLEPVVLSQKGKTLPGIESGDLVICFNFRTDRCREITKALTQEDMPDYNMKKLSLDYLTMTNYDDSFVGVKVLFDKDPLSNTLGEFLESENKTQLRMAETEKYPHVSFFFSGGREEQFKGESRIMAPSPKVATYDLKPEMSAYELKDKAINELKSKKHDFVCINFANPDMVGHTGVFDAIKSACEHVDACVKELIESGIESGYSFVIIADHGNADYAVNEDGSPNTAHSLNEVPIIVIDRDIKEVSDGILADVAPTILNLMGLNQPPEMTGKSLV